MRIQEWFGENIGYRFFGCLRNASQSGIFKYIKTKVPKNFMGRTIYDLGCGDGTDTLHLKQIFKPKKVIGYDHNDFLLERARKKGLEVRKLDINKDLPQGELATFVFSLHHAEDKEKTLREAVKKFDYIFLCEPILDLFHRLLDGGTPLSKQEWINIFNKTLKKYKLFQYKNNIIIFYQK
jgi:SAM-dependent methyltransferase